MSSTAKVFFTGGAGVVRWCVPCNARDRLILRGRCVVCGRRPEGSREPSLLALAVAELEAEGFAARTARMGSSTHAG